MSEKFDIQKYMTEGVEGIVKEAVRATLSDPKESAFMLGFAAASRRASKRRATLEKEDIHMPPFLIASITSSCNLHCSGCYSRCSDATNDSPPVSQLTSEEWLGIFHQAEDMGISFILLAGGEPLLRRKVIEAAGDIKDILFPIFTNGTYIDDRYLGLFDRCRNLIPVMSIEGGRETTDRRRGEGVYDKLCQSMAALHERKLIFGASVTVTSANAAEVTDEAFVSGLIAKGCRLIVYVEYVPADGNSEHLAPTDRERKIMSSALASLRKDHPEAVFVSFPGDEKSSGGCIAAGRGFFHINSHGGAEPCPFSPYSDINVRDTSLKDAAASPLFRALADGGLLSDDHAGGCVLYEKRSLVEALLAK